MPKMQTVEPDDEFASKLDPVAADGRVEVT
jgi:hypothetical protein